MTEPPANLIHRGIGRVEVFDFSPDRLPALRRFLSELRQPFSVHAPLSRPLDSEYPAVAVFFLSKERDFYRDLEVLAPAAKSAHLWNARDAATYRRLHHVPLHPSQRPEDGWIDIPRTLRILLGASPECRLIFEYREDGLPPAQIKEGFAWVAELAAKTALGH